MGLFKKLRDTLSGDSGTSSPRELYEAQVRCRRCGEVLTLQVDLRNDLSIDYDRDVLFVRKLISGSGANRCFQQIEVSLTFDRNKNLLDRQIAGGTFVDEPPLESS